MEQKVEFIHEWLIYFTNFKNDLNGIYIGQTTGVRA